jgi:AAA domain
VRVTISPLRRRYPTAQAFLEAVDEFWGANGYVAAADGRTFTAACPNCKSKSLPEEQSHWCYPLIVGANDAPGRWNLMPGCRCEEEAIAAALDGQGMNGSGPSDGERRALDGAAFIFGEPEHVPAVWGEGQRVAWSAGEPFWIVGPQGVGKTTVAQQLALRRAGVRTTTLLSFPVERDERRRVLYLALDRPRQAARSFRRMVGEDDAAALAERVAVWRGPLPFDLVAEPERLAKFAREHEAGTVFIDALKDGAMDLVKDEVGSRVNHALQHAVADGIEICVDHHQRKSSADNRKPRSLDDVYGSTWLTAGAGSVLLLWGEPGDPVVDVRHLKQPAEEVGPLRVLHDHARGETTPYESPELGDLLTASDGASAKDAARVLYESPKPSRSEVEKARRRLEHGVAVGELERLDSTADREPVRYRAREA